ncbi:GL16445 [Drosophila persimilis]|uniref:GL16445 n=1 Tax=Drosophila persimilis TaxID=7234 RepID=B4GWG9_DROPE|nr:GL16445 [Drosophila persimilis]
MESRVVDLDLACLICLNEEPGHSSIYSHDLEPPHTLIADKIRCCTSLKLESLQMQRWPDKICEQCHSELVVAYRFYEKCVVIEKLFLTATNSSHSVDADELARNQQLKLYLEQHHVKLPPSLKIKRVDVDAETPVASRAMCPATRGSAGASASSSAKSTTPYGPTANMPVIKVEYCQESEENTDSLPQIPEASRSVVMSLDTLIETVPMKEQSVDISDQESGKMIIPSPWHYDPAPEHFYQIRMEETVQSQKAHSQPERAPKVCTHRFYQLALNPHMKPNKNGKANLRVGSTPSQCISAH